MAVYSIYALAEADITIGGSGGTELSGYDQGAASHLLVGQTITLNTNAWEQVFITDDTTDTNFADTDDDQLLDGAQTIFGTSYADGLRVEAEYTITVTAPDGTPYTLIGFNINETGSPHPVYGTVEGLAFIGTFPPVGVPLTITGTSEGPSNSGGGSTPEDTYAEPPCFAPQTRIATPDGPRRAIDIRPGDLVETLDHGPQPVRWVSHSPFPIEHGDARCCPVLIPAGALGPGRPARDLVVSQQHRILVGEAGQVPQLAACAGLAPAKALGGLRGVRLMRGVRAITWVHLALARHEILCAEGAWAESLLLGPVTLELLAPMDRAAVRDLFAEAHARSLNGPPARALLGASQVRRRLAPPRALAAA